MRSFLILLILLGSAGDGYLYWLNLQQQGTYQLEIGDLNARLDRLTKEHQQLLDKNATLSKSLADFEAQQGRLKSQIQALATPPPASAPLAKPATAESPPPLTPAAPTPAPTPPPPEPASSPTLTGIDPLAGMGLNIHFMTPAAGELEMIAKAGFHWVRYDFKWGYTEKTAGNYDFSGYDQLVDDLHKFHIRPYFILDYGNPLYDEGLSPHTDAGRAAYTRWAVAAVRHFKERGVIWEVWNEPGGEKFWKPVPNADDYAKLAFTASEAIHAALPDERLVGPALDGGMKMDWVIKPAKLGTLKDWSAITIHPYLQHPPETYQAPYDKTRAVIKEYVHGDQPMDIYCGESGYSLAWNGMTKELQAKYLPRLFLFNLLSNIPITIWYDWRDDGTDAQDPEDNFGIVHHDYLAGAKDVYEPKPAYLAALTYAKELTGYRFKERLKIGSAENYILSFTNESDQRLVAWTTAEGKHVASIPVPDGAYIVTSYDGKTQTTVQSESGSITVALDDGPQYIQPQPPAN